MKGARAAAFVTFGLATLLVGRSSVADEDRRQLGLVGGSASLERSATIALSPWKIAVRDVGGAAPSGIVGVASREAQAIAQASGVDAVAWLVETSEARTLLLYDVHTGQVVSREVAAGPLDDAAAAAIALSLKTLLRASTVAPEQERLGGGNLGEVRGIGQFRLEGDATARLRASDGTRVDPRVGLAVAWWPGALRRYLGIALRVETGTGLAVQSHELHGRLADDAASFAIRARIPLRPGLAIEPAIGGALHLTLLDGATVDGHPVTDLSRIDPSLETSVQLTMGLGRSFEIGLRGSVLFWQRWQEYDIDDRAALTLSPVQACIGLVLGAALNP